MNFLNKTNNRDIFLDLLRSYDLDLSTIEPTRITATNETCIDNIFTNMDNNDIDVKTVNLHMGDHMAQIAEYRNDNKTPETNSPKLTRIFNNSSLQDFMLNAETYPWQYLYHNKSATEMSQ
ncbi:hypothetical protein QE152_g13656 [Popillia japonica]|uniref:Uncharacterized protein n=1 Tax=Popillia japonica TaxID=7064 RepID=A0AAW1LCA4_POPJA